MKKVDKIEPGTGPAQSNKFKAAAPAKAAEQAAAQPAHPPPTTITIYKNVPP